MYGPRAASHDHRPHQSAEQRPRPQPGVLRPGAGPAAHRRGEGISRRGRHGPRRAGVLAGRGPPVPTPLHVAFVAANRAQVDAFHTAALRAGAVDHGAPGLRPHYHANYYAAFVIGPDGHNIEAVCQLPRD
ncbi:glyoxalase/dioxygenase [Rhodanobacter thiooxydans LCS2]|nr:glyoxalase/dioxygenase [Rhodanobacter thiooxydans LCS2]